MQIRRKAALSAVIFTALVLLAVNIGWWWYYRFINNYLEQQLSQRLIGVAATASIHISSEQVYNLLIDDLDTYAEIVLFLDSLVIIDSLSEAAIIDIDFNYLASSRDDIIEAGYLLARPNFDSLQQAILGRPVTSELYNIDGTYLKSAYAPLFNSDDQVKAVLVAEAGAGYFGLLKSLRQNLYFLAGGSFGIVLILLVFYIIYSRRMTAAEEKIFQTASQAALGRMVAVVSHEIKNPLMIIHAAGERIEKKYNDLEASFITEEIARLDNIVSGYLSFAKGEIAINLQEIDILAMCQKIISEFEPQFKQFGVIFRTSLPEIIPFIHADRIGLRQVMINLLLNALHAVTASDSTKNNKIVILEVTSPDNPPGQVIIRISDSGPGIKSAHRERLFEPFFTTKAKGSGLGLFLSKRIIQAHRGTIKITDSQPGLTTFEIILPVGENK